ncbi:MAG: ammonium transporter [Patescibacteria group bacterium]|nr:ammonium transporter [Patescibacteria group bacterium]
MFIETAKVFRLLLLPVLFVLVGAIRAPADESALSEASPPAEEAVVVTEEVVVAAAPPTVAENSYAIDNLFLLIAAVLVLFMQAGFAMVECGFNESKNAVNVLFKNLMDLSIGVLLFFIIGYNLMYGEDVYKGFFAWGGFGISESLDPDTAVGAGVLHPQVDWLFQVAFAATAATIVSGAVAGRMQFRAYLLYSAVLTGLIYPISGFWKWGGGWLDALGMHDFAGSLLVHAVGGFAGLAGAIVLGPRIGRYTAQGKSHPILGHNLPLATLGVFILWIGWYGFNPGSQLAFTGAVNTNATVLIATNTTLAAAAGAFLAMLLGWGLFKKPDLSMALNGALAGLVGITANCDCVSNISAIIIGAIAGVLVVLGIILLDKLKIDDPVGVWPVHGLCGVWGGIATGIFGVEKNLVAQLIGTGAIVAWAFGTMLILFLMLKACGWLRVSAEEEIEGLDIGEHGMHAYGLPER